MSKHQSGCMCSDCQDAYKKKKREAWVETLTADDQERWERLQRAECPKCGGKKLEGMACLTCGFLYRELEKP